MRTFEVEDAAVPMLALAVAVAVHERRLIAMENVDSSSLASQQVRKEIAQLEDTLKQLEIASKQIAHEAVTESLLKEILAGR